MAFNQYRRRGCFQRKHTTLNGSRVNMCSCVYVYTACVVVGGVCDVCVLGVLVGGCTRVCACGMVCVFT